MKIRYIIYWASLLLIIAIGATAGEPVYLEHADEMLGQSDQGADTRLLIGNVKLRQGNVTVTCDKATEFINANKFNMSGHVVITQKTLKLRAPFIDYDGNTYVAVASGGVEIIDKETKLTATNGAYSTKTLEADFKNNVRIEDDSVIIFADYVWHSRKSRNTRAIGNVDIQGKYSNTKLLSDTVFHFPTSSYSVAKGEPILLQVDTTFAKDIDSLSKKRLFVLDTMTITCDTMIALRTKPNETYYFNGNLVMNKGNISARSHFGKYFKNRDIIELDSVPVVWYDSTQLHADSINIRLKNNKLNNLVAYRNALAISNTDTSYAARKEQIAGDMIEIVFESDSLKQIESTGNAKSLYFMSTDGNPDGCVRISSDKLIIEIKDGTAQNIIMIHQVPGEYYPEQAISGNEKDYYLPNYRWSNDRPKKIEIPIRESK